jgi:GNAT superfamily N-acetyltransferase
VGSCEVRWAGCAAEQVRARYPGCPEINGLQVWPAQLRSRGIGRALVAVAEDEARRRGYAPIGLGVADDNPRAAALYGRLGYADGGCRTSDRYSWLDDGGGRHDVADPCRFLVKQVDGA